MEMDDVIGAVTGAIGVAQRLVEFANSTKNAELKMAVADLTLRLAQVKIQMATLMDENANLQQQLKSLQVGSSELEFRDGLYFDAGGGGPFCPGCWDTKHQMIRVTKQKEPFSILGDFKCPSCEEFFNSQA